MISFDFANHRFCFQRFSSMLHINYLLILFWNKLIIVTKVINCIFTQVVSIKSEQNSVKKHEHVCILIKKYENMNGFTFK